MLEELVKEWFAAQKAIDALTPTQRAADYAPLQRLVDAHNALCKYAEALLTLETKKKPNNPPPPPDPSVPFKRG